MSTEKVVPVSIQIREIKRALLRNAKEIIQKNFHIDRYAGCETMGAGQWANSLLHRIAVVQMALDRKAELSQRDEADIFDPDSVMMDLLLHPLGKTEQTKVASRSRDYPAVYNVELVHVLPEKENVLMDDGARSAWEQWERSWEVEHSPETAPSLEEARFRVLTESLLEFQLRRFNQDKSGSPPSTTWAVVDLNVTEEKAADDFRKWWRVQQAALTHHLGRKPKTRFTDADFKRWAKLRVLAYIDLRFLSKYLSTNLTDDAIGSFLYPDDPDVAPSERIRKVTRPLADYLMDGSTIDALASQALHNKSENKI